MASARFLLGSGEVSVVVEVECASDVRWPSVRDELEQCGYERPTRAEGSQIPEDTYLGHPPLIDGAHLTYEPDSLTAGTATHFRVTVESGPRQSATFDLTPGTHILGRDHPLLGPDPYVSREHASIKVRHGRIEVRDLHSTGGLTLDGMPLESGGSVSWQVGSTLRIGSTLLALEHNAPSESHSCDSHRAPGFSSAAEAEEPVTLTWPGKPDQPERSPVRWLAVLVPIPLALGLAWWLHSPALLAFMIFAPLGLLASSWDDRRRGKQGKRAAAKQLTSDRALFQRNLADALNRERQARRRQFPPPHMLQETRTCDAGRTLKNEIPAIRLGHGSSPSMHTAKRGNTCIALTLHEAPVALRLKPGLTFLKTSSHAESRTVLELMAAAFLILEAQPLASVELCSPLLDGPRWLWVRGSGIGLHRTCDELPQVQQPSGSSPRRAIVVDSRVAGASECLPSLLAGERCVIWVGPDAPSATGTEIRLHHGFEASVLGSGDKFTLDDPPQEWFPHVTRLACLKKPSIARRVEDPVPTRVEPADVGHIPGVLLWDSGPTTAVPLGLGPGGEVVTLDLAHSGPHALVAGTTGSGKSEALLGYLHSLFVCNSPSALNALLIDYKGGATFGAIAQAPHVVGVVSDLDEGLGARALRALRAEILRRERALNELGTASYNQIPPGHKGLARLFVVVDEFRVLAEELPDFVSGLVRLAAVGRSLGIHLVLATQRPGGIVTADMRANLDARLLLRVRDRADSMDVIDSPVGAFIPREHPGRAYLAVGGEPPIPVQTTFVSGPTPRDGDSGVKITQLNPPRPALPQGSPRNESSKSEHTYVEVLVTQAREAAASLPPPHLPLLSPLPEFLTSPLSRRTTTGPQTFGVTWKDLLDVTPEPTLAATPLLPVARVDLPDAQAQVDVGPLELGLMGIAGASRSGRTLAAQRCAMAALAVGRSLWWCGAGPPEEATGRFNLDDPHSLAQLLEIMSSPTEPTTVIIDDWDSMPATLAQINRGMGTEDFLGLLRNAPVRGMNFVITGGRSLLSSRLTPLLDVRVALRHNDPSDYSLAGLRPHQVPRRMPPGRGLVLPHGHEVQFYVPNS